MTTTTRTTAPAAAATSQAPLVFFGAGTAGRYALKLARERNQTVLAFADNDPLKQGGTCDGVPVMAPAHARGCYPDAAWCATVLDHRIGPAVRRELAALAPATVLPVWECIHGHHGTPGDAAYHTMLDLAADARSRDLIIDQMEFRRRPDLDRQLPQDDAADIYFPEFISRRPGEHFVDCGAADGDTVAAFIARWPSWKQITAFEPDAGNMEKLRQATADVPRMLRFDAAISDRFGKVSFTATGDYTARVSDDGGKRVACWPLDDMWPSTCRAVTTPTYIKMDIEGSELCALWGARRIIREFSPVLAVCAYHESSHWWDVPLLLHALNPDLRLFFRRYAEAAFELVWYAVPAERVKVVA